jgi:hypothetical protein
VEFSPSRLSDERKATALDRPDPELVAHVAPVEKEAATDRHELAFENGRGVTFLIRGSLTVVENAGQLRAGSPVRQCHAAVLGLQPAPSTANTTVATHLRIGAQYSRPLAPDKETDVNPARERSCILLRKSGIVVPFVRKPIAACLSSAAPTFR